MKIEAKVKFGDNCMHDHNGFGVLRETVDVDEDYVAADEYSVYEWVANELYDMYGINFDIDHDFIIENIDDILDDLSYRGEED